MASYQGHNFCFRHLLGHRITAACLPHLLLSECNMLESSTDPEPKTVAQYVSVVDSASPPLPAQWAQFTHQ